MKNNKLLKQIALDGLFIALIIIFTFVPYTGYITIGLISFTTIHVIVLIGAVLFGYKKGALYGFVFGLMSLLKAINYPSTGDFLFVNPFVSVLPRFLFGLISGLIFDLLKKHLSQTVFNGVIFPLCGVLAFLHTLLTLTCLYIFGVLDVFKISSLLGLDGIISTINTSYGNLWTFIYGFLALGSVGEVAISIILVPTIYIIIYNNYGYGRVDKQIRKN